MKIPILWMTCEKQPKVSYCEEKQKREEQILYVNPYLWNLEKCISLVQFSLSVMSDSLQPHESQHQLLEFTQTLSIDMGDAISDAIQPSHPLSSPSPPAPNPSQHQGLFQ